MTIKIGLDMAQNSCGVAIYANKKLLFDSLILSAKEKKELDYIERTDRVIRWTDTVINGYYNKPHELIIEDTFLGNSFKSVENIIRVQGAYAYHYYALTGKKPILRMAVSARKNLSLRTRASKAEVQLWVIENVKLGRVSQDIKSAIDINLNAYLQKELPIRKFKIAMGKLSTLIAKETGIDEHMADAIILTL